MIIIEFDVYKKIDTFSCGYFLITIKVLIKEIIVK